jgi:tetratricopeptide (TPR) repeat protein
MVGNKLHNLGFWDAAQRLFKQGQEFDPEEYQFPLNLARVAVDVGRYKDAGPLLEKTLNMASDNPQAYIFVIDCWAVMDNVDEVQKVLDRARRELSSTTEFYVTLVKTLLIHSTAARPSSPFANLFAPPPPPEKAPEKDRWQLLAIDVMNQAAEAKPEDPELRYLFASELSVSHPHLALEQAEAGIQIAPEEPRGYFLLGLVQGILGQTKDAKATLRNAAKMARKQGNKQLADDADALRRDVDNPFFQESIRMGMMGDIFDELDDELDDEDLDFFL